MAVTPARRDSAQPALTAPDGACRQLTSEVHERGGTFLALTGGHQTPLARIAHISLPCAAAAEGELLGVLPEASTLAAHLVINALLAECASRLRLSPADLRKHHPGGAIGRRLADCMPRRDSL